MEVEEPWLSGVALDNSSLPYFRRFGECVFAGASSLPPRRPSLSPRPHLALSLTFGVWPRSSALAMAGLAAVSWRVRFTISNLPFLFGGSCGGEVFWARQVLSLLLPSKGECTGGVGDLLVVGEALVSTLSKWGVRCSRGLPSAPSSESVTMVGLSISCTSLFFSFLVA